MNAINRLIKPLQHSLMIVVSCIFLNACGGDSLQLANGIGGTGITAIGRITAFGSVYVNGVHYNTDNAQFQYNGQAAQQDSLAIGNIVRVKGTINPDKKTGVAELVTYADTITGPVTQKAAGNTIEVMKQSIITDELTLFYGFKKLTDLAPDNIVEISGFTAAGGKIKASSIRLKSKSYIDGTELELEGFISNINTSAQTFNVDDLIINYAQAQFSGTTADTLEDDLYLIITTNDNLDNDTLNASNIKLDDQLLSGGVHYEIEGFITEFASSQAFSVDYSPVITNEQTVITPSGQTLKQDRYVRVSGTSNLQGKLVAETITVINTDSEVVVESTLQSIDLAQKQIQILGQTAQINTSTLLLDDQDDNSKMLTLDDFAVGDSVFAVIRQDGNGFTVARLSKIDALSDTFLIGFPDTVETEQATLTLFNQVIQTGNATFFDENENSLSQAEFFTRLSNLGYEVMVTGQASANGMIDAKTLDLVNSP